MRSGSHTENTSQWCPSAAATLRGQLCPDAMGSVQADGSTGVYCVFPAPPPTWPATTTGREKEVRFFYVYYYINVAVGTLS